MSFDMSSAEWIAIVALLISGLSFLISFLQNRQLAYENMRLQEAAFYQHRNFEFESRLADWPDAYRFFGIDIDKIRREEGISEQQITYLCLSIHALHAYCRAQKESIYQHIRKNDYRQWMFSNEDTRRAWRYARLLFSDYIRGGVDQYLTEQYPDD